MGDIGGNQLTFSVSGTNLVVTDSTGITAGAGVTQVNATTVQATLADITGTLDIDTSDGTDTVAFGTVDLRDAGIKTRNAETVSVDAGAIVAAGGGFDVETSTFTSYGSATISTRRIPVGGDPAAAHSTDDSGDLSIVARNIEIQAGSRLLAHVEESSSFEPGEIRLKIDVGTIALPFIPQVRLTDISLTIGGSGEKTEIRGGEVEIEGAIKNDITLPKRVIGYTDQTVSITIENASIEGESVSIVAESEDKSLLEELPEWVTANFIEPVVEFLVDKFLPKTPISAMIRGAKATVSLQDVEVSSAGDVTLASSSVVDASTEAVAAYDELLKIAHHFSAGYSQATSTAKTTVEGDSLIQAGGNVTIGTDTTATAAVTARTTSNINLEAPASARDVVVSLAITNSKSTSQATIGEQATIIAGGNVAITSEGTITNNAVSGATTYIDGAAGVSVSLAFDDSDVTAQVDGTVRASGQDVTRELLLTNVSGNMLTIPNHGFQDGQIIEYQARDPNDPSIPLDPIGGLLSGEKLRVIVVDQDTIQLARVAPLDIDNTGADPASTQSFSRRDAVVFNPQIAVEPATSTITLAGHGFTPGQQLDYGVGIDEVGGEKIIGEAIGGLVDQTAYFAIPTGINTFRLAATREDATAPTPVPISLTDRGLGTTHIFAFNQAPTPFSPTADFDRVTDAFTVPGHGFATGDALVYATDPTLTKKTTFSRTAVFDPNEQTSTVDPTGTVDLNELVLNLSTNTLALVHHDLSTGDAVTYSAQGGERIGGLDEGVPYFVIRVDERYIQLAVTPADAVNAVAIDLEAGATLGSGPHELTTVIAPRTIAFDPTGTVPEPVVNTVSDTIAIVPFHNYVAGQRLRYQTGGGASIGGLSNASDYFAIPVNEVAFQLAASRANALAGVAIDLTDGATGAAHQFITNEVDTVGDLIISPSHEMETGEKVIYLQGDGDAISPLTDGNEYYVIRLDANTFRLAGTLADASAGAFIAISSTGSGTMQGVQRDTIVSTFDPTRTVPVVDTVNNSIELPGHGLNTGDEVNYQASGGSAIGGLADNTNYFAIYIDADHIQLAATAADALTGTEISLSSGATLGAGLHVLRVIPEVNIAEFPDRQIDFDPTLVPALDLAADTIRMPNHRLATADPLTYLAGSGTPIGGLVNGTEYYVIVVDANTIRLAASPTDAIAGTRVDLTAGATGDRHGLQRISTLTQRDPALRGLTNAATYFAIRLDDDTFRLAASKQDALAAAPIALDATQATGTAHEFQPVDEVAGVLVAAHLTADNRANAGAGIGGEPTLADLLTKAELQTSLNGIKGILNADFKDRFHHGAAHGSGTTTNSLFSGAAGISLNIFEHTVRAQLGATAQIESDGDFALRSEGTQRAQVTAQGNIFLGSAKKFASGVAVALGFYTNDVQAIVDGDGSLGASIDAAGQIDISSELEYPLLVEPLELVPFSSFFENASEGNVIGDLASLLDGSLGLTRIFNVWVASSAYTTKQADLPTVAISGSLGYTQYTNTSAAIVRDGAQLNQHVQNDEQKVAVEAATNMELINVTGIMYLFLNERGFRDAFTDKDATSSFDRVGNFFSFFGNKSSTFGMGGSAMAQVMDNTTTALIEGGVAVYSGRNGGLDVTASQDIYSLEFAQSGGDSGSIGISGSIVWVDQTSHTIAQLASGALVTGGPVNVLADDQTTHTSIAGAAQLAKRLGIGVGFALLDIDRTTLAILGKQRTDSDDTIGSAGTSLDVSSLKLEATSTGKLWSFGLVGALASNIPTGEPAARGGHAGPVEATSGVALAGDAAVNTITNRTQAYINDDGTIRSGDVTLEARDDTSMSTVTGAAAIGAKPDGTIGGALAGSFSYNDLQLTTEAFLVGATVARAANVTVEATAAGSILAVSAGLAGALAKNSFVIAGSFSWNEVTSNVRAYVDRAVLQQLANLEVSADDTSSIEADGGGAAIALSRANQGFGGAIAFGVSAAINNLTPTVQAYLAGATVTDAAGVVLDAKSQSDIKANTWAGAIAGAASGTSGLQGTGAGAGSGNTITSTVEALIRDSSDVSTASGGDILLTVTDTPSVFADAGGVAASVERNSGTNVPVAFGAAASYNGITGGTIQAAIEDSTVTSRGQLTLEANSAPEIEAISISLSVGAAMSGGGGAGITLVGAGAGSGNEIRNTTAAAIREGSTVATIGSGDIRLDATDTSVITAVAPAISLAFVWSDSTAFSLEVGISITSNEIANTLQANIDDSSVTSAGSLDVAATSTATSNSAPVAAVPTLTISSATSISLSGVGAQAFNTITSDVEASITGGSHVTTAGDVNVTAVDDATINANVVVATITVNVGENATGSLTIEAAKATNQIGTDSDRQRVRAFIEDSTVTAHGAIDVSATSTANIAGLTVGVGLSISATSGISAALDGFGAETRNTLRKDVEAAILGSSSVSTTGSGTITVQASESDNPKIDAQSTGGSLGGGFGTGSFSGALTIGVVLTDNNLANRILAHIDEATVTAGGDVHLDARSTSVVDSLTVFVSLAIAVASTASLDGAGDGANSTNTLRNTIEAYILDSQATVTSTGGSVVLAATDHSTVNAQAGGGNLAVGFSSSFNGSIAVAVVLATNDIGNTVDAFVDNSTVVAAADVQLTATSQPKITATTVAIALAGSGTAEGLAAAASAAASKSENTLGGTVSSHLTYAQVTAGGSVRVTSNATPPASGANIKATAPAVSVGISATDPFAGVAFALDGAGGSVTNDAKSSIQAFMDGSSVVTASGAIEVAATDTVSLEGKVVAVSVALSEIAGAIAVALVTNTYKNEVQSYIEQAAVSSTNGTVSITADSTPTATATAIPVAVSVEASGDGANATSNIDGSVAAWVTDQASLTALAGDVTVQATSTAQTTAEANGGGGSLLLTISALLANAAISQTTTAYVSGGSTVTAAGLSVVADATQAHATANVLVVGIGGIAGGGGRADARISGDVTAFVGPESGTAPSAVPTSIQLGAGTLTVQAKAESTTAHADGRGGDGGLVEVSVLVPFAQVSSDTQAYVGEGTTVRAGALSVEATADLTANGTAFVVGIAALTGDGVNATAKITDDSHTAAFVGPADGTTASGAITDIVLTGGPANVTATLNGLATTNISLGTGSLIMSGAGTVVDSAMSGQIAAYLGDHVRLSTSGDVTLHSVSQSRADATSFGVAVSTGLAAFGTKTTVLLDPTLHAFTGSGVTLAAQNINVLSSHNVDSTTGAALMDKKVQADGTAGSGGLIAGGEGANVQGTVAPTIDTRLGAGTTVNATGTVTVASRSYQFANVNAHADGGAGVVTVGVTLVTGKSQGTVNTHIEGHIASADAVVVQSVVTAEVDASGEACSVAIGAATTGTNVQAIVGTGDANDPLVATSVSGSGQVAATHDVDIRSLVTTKSLASSSGFNGAVLLAVGSLPASSLVHPVVRTQIDDGARVISSAGNIQVLSGHNYDLQTGKFLSDKLASVSTASTGGSGGLNVSDTAISADAKADVMTVLAAGATVNAVAGQIDVESRSSNLADAYLTNSGGAGLAFIGIGNATGTAHGKTSAQVLAAIETAGAGMGANHVNLLAQASDIATGRITQNGGGGVSVASSTAKAEAKPTVSANVAGTLRVSGNITIDADSFTDADANIESSTGGVVDVTDYDATVTVTPTVAATVADNAVLSAGNEISISTNHGRPAELSDGTFDAQHQVKTNLDPTAPNTIVFSEPHGLQTGADVTYEALGNPPIPGLGDGRTYCVVVTDDTSLQLGDTFLAQVPSPTAPAGVNLADDTIIFPAPHNLQGDGQPGTSDRVVYTVPSDSTVVGGLQDGKTYLVNVVDTITIRLVDPDHVPAAPQNFAGTDVQLDLQTIMLVNHGFVLGQAVTYTAPTPAVTSSYAIDVDVTTDASGNPTGVTPNPAANNIYFGAAVMTEQGFQDGDIVIYTAGVDPNTGLPVEIGGLVDGSRYAVIFDPAQPNQIQLEDLLTPGTPIELDTTGVSTSIPQTFRKVDDQPIGGLTDQQTYYVVYLTLDTFQLAPTHADALAGTNLITLDPIDPETIAVLAGTRNTLGTRGVDLTSVGSGRHHLVIEITATSTGQQQLAGIGGAAGLADAPSGDGIATASVSGGGGGLVSVESANTSATSTPTSTLTIGQSASLRANDITLAASSAANVAGSADNNNGGFVAVSSGRSSVSTLNTAQVVVNNQATLDAADDIEITSTTSESANTLTDIGSSGFAGLPTANASAHVDYASTIDIYAATITAGAQLTIDAQSDLSANVTAIADGSGAGSGSFANDDSDEGLFIGKTKAWTRTTIHGNAQLTAETLMLKATVTSVDANVSATALGAGVGGNSNATGLLVMNDTAEVVLDTNATLTGQNIDLSSTHDNIIVKSYSNSRCDCFAGADNSTAQTDYNSTSSVTGQTSALLTAANLTVSTTQNVTTYKRDEHHGGGFLVFGSHHRYGHFNAHRDIAWDATVGLLGNTDPQLVVDSDALIVAADGVTIVTDTGQPLAQGDTVPAGRTIVVQSLANTAAGQVVFEANALGSQDDETPPLGTISGSHGVFNFQRSFGNVEISNASSRDLQINGITAFSAGDPSEKEITINVQRDADFSFDVSSVAPTAIDIANTHPTAAPLLILAGVIDNPIGTTTISNVSGDIVATGSAAIVRTNALTITAAGGNIGATGGVIGDHRVNVQLVQSQGHPTALQARAGGDNALSIQGLLRDPAVADFRPQLDLVAAGGEVDLLLLAGLLQTTSGSTVAGVRVEETARVLPFPDSPAIPVPPASASHPPRTTTVASHWPSGAGPTPSSVLGMYGSGTTTIPTTYEFTGTFSGGTRRVQAGEDITFQGCAAAGCGGATSEVSLLGNVVLASLTNGLLYANTNGSIDLTAVVAETTNRALRVGLIESTDRSVTLTVPDTAAIGEDLILFDDSLVTPAGSRINAGTTITLVVGDNLIMAGDFATPDTSSQLNAGTTVVIHADTTAPDPDPGVGSVIDLRGQISGNLGGTIADPEALKQVVQIQTGNDADLVSLTNVASGTGTTIHTQGGDDLVQVGSLATVAIGSNPPASWNPQNTGGVLSGIRALLTIAGGDGQDTLDVDDSGNTAPSAGALTSSTISGLFGAGGSISYATFESLNIALGSAGDTFTVAGTHSGATTLAAHAGADTIHVRATQGPLQVDTGGETVVNTVYVGSLAPSSGGVLDAIQGALTLVGNGHDTLHVDDTGSTASKTGTLEPESLTGLGMGASGIQFSGIAVLTIDLGSGDDSLTISGNSAPFPPDLTIDGHLGTDQIFVNADLELGLVVDLLPISGQLTLRADDIYLNAGTISTNGAPAADQVLLDGDVTLGTDVSINTDGATADGNILVTGSIAAGGYDLTLTAGEGGDLTLSGPLVDGGILLVLDANVQSYQGLDVYQLDIRDATTSITFFGIATSTTTADVISGGTIWLRQAMTAVDEVVFRAGTDITFDAAGDLSSTNSTVEVTADADLTGGAAAGAIIMTDGSVIFSGGGLIQLTASGNVTLGSAVTPGEVQVTSRFAAIVDGGDTDPDIWAARAALRAQSGIGDAGDPLGGLETQTYGLLLILAAVTDRGDIQVFHTGALQIGTVDSLQGIVILDSADDNLGDNIVVTAASPQEVNQPVINNDGGDITLAAEGNTTADDLTINANITAVGGAGSIFLYAGDSIRLAGAVTVSAASTGAVLLSAGSDYNGNSPIDGYDGGNVILASSSVVSSEDGHITVNAPNDVYLSFLNADSNLDNVRGDVTVTADYGGPITAGGIAEGNLYASNGQGAILDNTAGEARNIRAGLAILRAATGIGSGGGNADLDTNIVTLDALNSTSGDIAVTEVAAGGNLDVQLAAQSGASGNITIITENGNLRLIATGWGVLVCSSIGTVWLDANVVNPADESLTRGDVVLNQKVTTFGGAITLDADHDVRGLVAGTISSYGGPIAITADANNAGPAGNDFGTIQLRGDIAAGAGLVTFSLADCDGWIGAAPGSITGNVTAGAIVMGNDAKPNGQGVLRLQGRNNTFSDTVTVVEGTLIINGILTDTAPHVPAGGDVVVQDGGVLGGHGDRTTTGVINASITVLAGGILDPGDYANCTPQTGQLTVNLPDGAVVDIQFGGTFRVQLGGLGPGAATNGYDQLVLNGPTNADLHGTQATGAGGGTLLVDVQFGVPFGAEFRIIDNDLTDLITTRFLNLPEMAFLSPGGVLMNISYLAGSDKNDVVLTRPGRYDFDGYHGYTAENYIGISPFTLYGDGNAMGWLTLPPRYFERNWPVLPPYTAPEERLKYDGQSTDRDGNPLTFAVDLVAGQAYEVMILTGDVTWNHDRMRFDVYDAHGTQPPETPTLPYTRIIDTWGAGAPDGSGVLVTWGGGDPNTEGTGYYRWIRFTTDTIVDADNGLGTLLITMRDLGGWDYTAVILGMDIRPVDSVGEIAIGRSIPPGTVPLNALAADGMTVDTYTGSGAPPFATLNVTVSAGSPVQYAKVSPDGDITMFGVRVMADDRGEFSFSVLRPATLTDTSAAEENWTILVEEVSGLSRGTTLQPYAAPEQSAPLRFDFGISGSPVQPDFLPVIPQTTYSATRGYGWTTRVAGANRQDPNMSALRTDLNYAKDATFRVDLPDGNYSVRVYHSNPKYHGVTTYIADNFRVYAEGAVQYTIANIPAGTTDIRTFTVTVTDGALDIRFQDFGGWDGNFVVSGIEISAGTLPGVAPLLAAGDPLDSGATAITTADLAPVVAEATARWMSTGLTAEQAAALQTVRYRVTDLGGAYLGLADVATNSIRIDDDAARFGWALVTGHSSSGIRHSSLVPGHSSLDGEWGQRTTDNGQRTNDGLDLLTVVMHELGHLLGYDHSDDAGDLMAPVLAAGRSRALSPLNGPSSLEQALDAWFAELAAEEEAEG